MKKGLFPAVTIAAATATLAIATGIFDCLRHDLYCCSSPEQMAVYHTGKRAVNGRLGL